MYKVFYPQIPNMGDLLNKVMLEAVFGIEVKRADIYQSNLTAIGSSMSDNLFSDNKYKAIKQQLYRPFMEREHHIWGTGFLSYLNGHDNQFLFKNVHIHSLRGELTRKRVEVILHKNLDVPLGDGGLLADQWVKPMTEKKYRIGIIPHFREKDHPLISEMLRFYSDSVLVDLEDPPVEVVQKIASCELILSSSLHGLIIADSYHIPNRHMRLYPFGERIAGDGYKFADYYSSFGLEDCSFDATQKRWPACSDIASGYEISPVDVEKKKKSIYEAFPKL